VSEPNSKESKLEFFKVAKKKVINSFEKSYLAQLLTECKGDIIAVARKSGKSHTAVWNILKKHNLSPKQFRK